MPGSPGSGLALAGDGELLAEAARGVQRAFAELVSRHYKPVFRLVWRLTAGHADTEDITQEAFLKLWQNPGQVREQAALRGWLMRVAANAVTDRGRRKKPVGLDEAPEIEDGRPDQLQSMAGADAARTIDARLAGLPERQRLALSLVYFEGLSNQDAAAVMETSIEAVESLLARARRTLKGALAGEWRELLDGLNGAGR